MSIRRSVLLLISILVSGFLSARPLWESGAVLSAVDPSGTSSAALFASITVTTLPPGLPITVDGALYTSPQVFNWGFGTLHTISVSSPQTGGGTRRVFIMWDDAGALTHSISVGASDMTYTAIFSSQYLLSTASSPIGAGGTSVIPPSADGYYLSGTTVQLIANPASGYTFIAWGNDLAGSTNPQTIVMSAPRSVTANFAKISGITVATNPPGLQITIDGTSYTAPKVFNWVSGSQHTISVFSPQTGAGTRRVFSSWSDGGATTHSITVGASDMTYTANFAAQYLLSTATSPVGAGSIGVVPSGTDAFYESGTSVQLTAYPASGYTFTAWSNDLTGSANPQTILMSAPRSVTANFRLTSEVDELTVGLPEGFSLSHNYPNPFNPSTTIRYDLPHDSHVSLSIFNTLGLRVALLIEREDHAGYHEVRFDGSGLAAGVYFYRLQADEYVETKKMTVVK